MMIGACSSGTVLAASASAKVAQTGDVLLAIDGHPIASDGFVELEGERVEMPEVVERKFRGNTVKLDILRNKQPMSVTVALGAGLADTSSRATATIFSPRYIVYGGLLFQPISLDLFAAYRLSDLRVRHYLRFFRRTNRSIWQHPEVIILTNILPDPINTYFSHTAPASWMKSTGQKIGTLEDLARAFAQPPERFVVQDDRGRTAPRARSGKVESARERIKTRYNVIIEQNLDEQPPAQPAVAAQTKS